MDDKRIDEKIVPLDYASPPKADSSSRSALSILGTIIIIWIWVAGAMVLLLLLALIAARASHG